VFLSTIRLYEAKFLSNSFDIIYNIMKMKGKKSEKKVFSLLPFFENVG